MTITRRGFLGMLHATVIASAVPWPKNLPVPALAFRKDAFSSINFMKQADVRHFEGITRVDVLFGFAKLPDAVGVTEP